MPRFSPGNGSGPAAALQALPAFALAAAGASLLGRGSAALAGLLLLAPAAGVLARRRGARTAPVLSVVVLAGFAAGTAVGALAGAAALAARPHRRLDRALNDAAVLIGSGALAGAVATLGPSGELAALGRAALAVVAATALTLAAGLTGGDAFEQPFSSTLAEAAVGVPLLALLGEHYRKEPLLVLAVLAALLVAAAAADRLRAGYRSERALARRDELTGTANRRAGREALEREQERIGRGGPPAGLLLVDVDRFKQVNDRYGYQTGDRALQELVCRLEGHLRKIDLLARWGGEEFIVLAPAATQSSLLPLAEKLRRVIEERPFAADGRGLSLTISVGAALLDGGEPLAEGLRRANRALRRAKLARNAVVIADPAPGELEPLDLLGGC